MYRQFITFRLAQLIFGVLVFSNCLGQIKGQRTTVLLKTGEIIEGELIEFVFQDHVSLILESNDTLTIQWKSILDPTYSETELERRNKKKLHDTRRRSSQFRDNAKYLNVSLGMPIGLGYEYGWFAGFSSLITAGKGFGYRSHIGLRTGYEFYPSPQAFVIPLGLDYYGKFNATRKSWYYGLSGGYSFAPFSEYKWLENGQIKGGVFLNPYIGITRKGRPRTAWNLEFGYKTQKVKAEYDGIIKGRHQNIEARLKHNVTYYRFEIRLGLRFD